VAQKGDSKKKSKFVSYAGRAKRCSLALQTLLTCIDGLYGTKTLEIVRSGDRLLASGMDNTRRDALKSASRVATKAVAKSADVLSEIAGADSSDPCDLAVGAGSAPSPAMSSLAVDVLPEPGEV
jgi:hypothetical protein